MCDICKTVVFLILLGLMVVALLNNEKRIDELERENRHLKADRRFLETVIELERCKKDENN